MPHEVPPEAEDRGFGAPEMDILYCSAYWRNGKPIPMELVSTSPYT